MKPLTQDFEIESTVKPTHSIAMSLDMTSLPHLFKVLSGLYSDKEMAVLRELSTNARDSHIEAGQTRPIEVTLPVGGEFGDNDLIIEDFGVGMSRTEIEDTYSKYGASTKRHSDDYNGTLGLGSKSPLTYTPQFTFVGIKDGIRTTVSVSMPDQLPIMNVLSEKPTDEPNGVKVIVPARAANLFRYKADRLFRFWDPETVLINGEKPTPITGMKVTENIMVTTETDSKNYVVMAGVPYPVNMDHGLLQGHALVTYVETGGVAFVPSREALDDTPGSTTRERLAAIVADYEQNVHKAVQAQVEKAVGPREAFKSLAAWRAALGVKALRKHEFKYNGKVIPVEFAPKNEKVTVSRVDSNKLSEASREAVVQIEVVVEALCVYGFDTHFTASHKKKLNKYVEDNNIEGVKHYVLANKKLPLHWLDKDRIVDFEVIRAIKLPRVGGQVWDPNRPKGSYDMYVKGIYREGIEAVRIDTAAPVYYVCKTNFGKHWSDDCDTRAELLTKYKRGNWTMVVLTSNRVDKFKRDFPQAVRVDSELARIYKRVAARVTDDERMADYVQQNWDLKASVRNIDTARVDDPAFGRMKALVDFDLKGSALRDLSKFGGIHLPGVTHAERKSFEHITDPLEPYELIGKHSFASHSGVSLSHVYEYMNLVYANRQQADATRDHNNERGTRKEQ